MEILTPLLSDHSGGTKKDTEERSPPNGLHIMHLWVGTPRSQRLPTIPLVVYLPLSQENKMTSLIGWTIAQRYIGAVYMCEP